MKRLFIGIAALAALIAMPAVAADIALKAPPPVSAPAYNWTGFYVGGNVGYGWGVRTDPIVSFVDSGAFFGTAAYFAAGGNVTPNVRPAGVIGGGQVGINWTLSSSWVAGLVTDFQGSGVQASATNFVAPCCGLTPSNQTNGERIDWFGTLRAKLGYGHGQWLLYGTGGLAYGRVNTSGSLNVLGIPPATPVPGLATSVKAGWTAGAGLNYGLTPNWIVGVEYLYVDLGRVSYVETINAAPAVSANTISNRAAVNIGRMTLDYKF